MEMMVVDVHPDKDVIIRMMMAFYLGVLIHQHPTSTPKTKAQGQAKPLSTTFQEPPPAPDPLGIHRTVLGGPRSSVCDSVRAIRQASERTGRALVSKKWS